MRRVLRRFGWALAAGAVGVAGPAWAQGPARPWAMPVNMAGPVIMETTSLPDGHARLEEMKVELAWLGHPSTFGYGLSAVAHGTAIRVRGYVPNEAVHDIALKLAREHTLLVVLDEIKLHERLAMRSGGDPAESLEKQAAECLATACGDFARTFDVKVKPNGQVTLCGSVPSVEDKLAASRCLRRVRGCTSVVNQLAVASMTKNGQSYTVVSKDGELLAPEALLTATAAIPPGATVMSPERVIVPVSAPPSVFVPGKPAPAPVPVTPSAGPSPYQPVLGPTSSRKPVLAPLPGKPVGPTLASLPKRLLTGTTQKSAAPAPRPAPPASKQPAHQTVVPVSWSEPPKPASVAPRPGSPAPLPPEAFKLTPPPATAKKPAPPAPVQTAARPPALLPHAFKLTPPASTARPSVPGASPARPTTGSARKPAPTVPAAPYVTTGVITMHASEPEELIPPSKIHQRIVAIAGNKARNVEVIVEGDRRLRIHMTVNSEADGKYLWGIIERMPEVKPYEISAKVQVAR